MSRVIGGRAGGQRLAMPAHQRTRPTTDRVREAVFSALATWNGTADRPGDEALAGVAFCDLYGGSGAVALEAASRGAGPVVCVEADRRTADVARANARTTGLAVIVRVERAERFVAAPGERFDVVWLDPPYDVGTEAVEALVADLLTHDRLADDGLVVVERATRSRAPEPPGLAERWSRRYGETTVHYLRRAAP